MQRVHPNFMDEFVKNMESRRFEEANDGLQKGLQYWVNVINNEINPIDSHDAPLIIAALKGVTESISKSLPGAEKAADALLAKTQSRTFVVRVKHEE